ncbi:carboxymuconolactone decarboxylase [Fusarium acutatum]|uniref:Carboxymuconolactone decarboxylase n=1 Tax=Fusarium acutatum TaxID=78861 RepID=A0A8H4JM41_9HYPO|nr:carboxymuconolactone decarboxylase [Fusarium acutatum]
MVSSGGHRIYCFEQQTRLSRPLPPCCRRSAIGPEEDRPTTHQGSPAETSILMGFSEVLQSLVLLTEALGSAEEQRLERSELNTILTYSGHQMRPAPTRNFFWITGQTHALRHTRGIARVGGTMDEARLTQEMVLRVAKNFGARTGDIIAVEDIDFNDKAAI